jgi:DNA replication protein DnaC
MDFSAIAKDLMDSRDLREIEEYGKILSDEEREEKEKELEAARKDESIKKRINLFLETVPLRFKNATFDTFICTSEKQKSVIDFLKKGKSAVIYGSNGTGKTHLAFASCLHQVSQGKTAKYVLAFDFFNAIRKSFSDYTTDRIIQEYGDVEYLVIDEIDKTQGTPMEYAYLYSLINKRYNEMRSTILITNAKPDEFVAIIGQSALDRVASEGKVIDLTGENYRQRKHLREITNMLQ